MVRGCSTQLFFFLLFWTLSSRCCVQGDVKGYLRSCRTAETMTPEPLILQRMACDIASGLLHLHKHNFTHRYTGSFFCCWMSDMSGLHHFCFHGCFLEQYPGAAWVLLTDSSISDFVAGGDSSSPEQLKPSPTFIRLIIYILQPVSVVCYILLCTSRNMTLP